MGVAGLWRGFSRVGGVGALTGGPRALLGVPVARRGPWPPSAARAAGAVRREPGRAQRGLDLSKEHLTYSRAVFLP